MKKYILGIVILAASFSACSKGGDSSTTTTPPVVPPPVAETKITAALDIDKGDGSVYGALGASQVVNIAITNLPKAGVTVSSQTTRDLDGAVVSSTAEQSFTSTPIPITIDNLKSGELCTVTFTVTSKSDKTNTLSPKVKIARK